MIVILVIFIEFRGIFGLTLEKKSCSTGSLGSFKDNVKYCRASLTAPNHPFVALFGVFISLVLVFCD